MANPEIIPVNGDLERAVSQIPAGGIFLARLTLHEWTSRIQVNSHDWLAARLRAPATPEDGLDTVDELDTAYFLGHRSGNAAESDGPESRNFVGDGRMRMDSPLRLSQNVDSTYSTIEDFPTTIPGRAGSRLAIHKPSVEFLIGQTAADAVAKQFGHAVMEHLADPDSTLDSMLREHHETIFPIRQRPDLYTFTPDLSAMKGARY